MKAEWKAFLTDAGAEFNPDNGDEVASFGNPEREKRYTLTGTVLCDLSRLGLIEVHGEDAETFLQGQLTNDVTQIKPDTSHLGGYCNPKGRLLATFRMFRLQDTWYLMMPEELVEPSLKRLQMFVLMSKVTLGDAGCAMVRFGLSGHEAEAELKEALGDAPEAPDQAIHVDGVTAIRVHGEIPRYILLGELEAMQSLWNRLNVRGAPAGASSWRLLDIVAGVPTVYESTREAFVPQMINLELLEGVSFQKGCYTGQEIIARTHYLGKLKRRLYRLHVESDEPPAPGTEVFSPENETGQPIGAIVDAAPWPEGGVEALAVVTIQYADPDKPLNIGAVDGPAATLQLPPYPLELKIA
ncbi:MAG TPA: folate-binding protein [Gammaproteobacteria bacterium]|nr:folate-binding protein [Gammaproteobacteria bacterium]